MSEQSELVYKILRAFDNSGLLGRLLIVGSWCVYFYSHHFEEGRDLPPIKTRDIEFDVSGLAAFPGKVSVPRLLESLDFLLDFKGDGYITLVHPQLIIEFLSPEHGKGTIPLRKFSNVGIVTQPLRFLSLLEEETINISYRDVTVRVPDPARFAVHKLIVSRRRVSRRPDKAEKDIQQALAVFEMLIKMGKAGRVKEVLSTLPGGWLKIVRTAWREAEGIELRFPPEFSSFFD